MSQIAVSWGRNAVPAYGGDSDPSRIQASHGAVPAPGSGSSLPTESEVIASVRERPSCAGTTKNGSDCGAPPAKGTEWCAGHLRSRGEL